MRFINHKIFSRGSIVFNMDTLTGFQRDLLIVISEEPKVGLDIKSELEDYYENTDSIKSGKLFPNLDVLVEKEYVTKNNYQYAKRTNIYELTQKGREVIENHHNWRDSFIN